MPIGRCGPYFFLPRVPTLAASGYGVSVLLRSALSELYRSELVVAIPFEEPAPMRRVALARRRNSAQEPVVQPLMAAVHGMNKSAYQVLA